MHGWMAMEGHTGSFIIEGFGIAEITVWTYKGSIHRLRFPASHTLSFSMNLLSLPSMDKKGYRSMWGGGQIEVRHPKSGEVVVDGWIAAEGAKHGLYQVNVVDNMDKDMIPGSMSTANPDSSFVLALAHSCLKPCSLSMWHTRFGHADINMIWIMAKHELVEGLDVSDFSLCGKCKICLFAKAKQQPFDDIVVPSAEPLD
jgi:GAG-pre-integrase domain